jgi:hypothetical protein
MKRAPVYLVPIWLAVLSTACAPEGLPGEAPAPDVEARQQALTNATPLSSNPIFTAIYHFQRSGTCTPPITDVFHSPLTTPPSGFFWPRPCSGRVIRRNGNEFFILTARHCVTQNSSIMGPLALNGDLKVTTATTPGVIPTFEMDGFIMPMTAPPASIDATVFAAGANNGQIAEDRAIIKASGLNITSGRTAIYAGTPGELLGITLLSEGYGRSVEGHCYGHNGSGAGVLRQGYGFRVDQSVASQFVHTFDSIFTAGQHQLGGDSGSPLHYMNQLNGTRYLVGVTSTQVDGAGGADIRQWLQDQLGHLYLVHYDRYRGSSWIVGAQQFDGGSVGYAFTGDTAETRLVYDAVNKQLRFGSFCVADAGNGNTASRPCNSGDTTQKWNYGQWTSQFSNVGTGKCLDAGAKVNAMPCQLSNRQSWLFITDDDQLAAGL